MTRGFRTYSQLVEEMGDTPKKFLHSGKTEDHFLIAYGNMVRKLKQIPSSQDWIFNGGLPTPGNYRRKFKVSSWDHIAFKFYDYAKEKVEWQDIINLIPEIENIPPVTLEINNQAGYVYFMLDSKNGYYKIGISNEPEWREKTLQSEKPSIKLIAAKKFVNRRIAANFEKALHESYSHKRKRGEWFQLDREDIDEIKITLNS